MLQRSKRKLGLLATIIPLTLVSQKANAQLSIVISGTAALNFGAVSENGAGTVIVTTAGGRSTTGGITAVTGAGTHSNGVVSLSGSTGLAIDVSMTAGAFTIVDGGNTMVVNNFNLETVAGGATRTITLAANPTTFPIGATLNVGAGQPAGTYIGDYTINANYQ